MKKKVHSSETKRNSCFIAASQIYVSEFIFKKIHYFTLWICISTSIRYSLIKCRYFIINKKALSSVKKTS